MDRIKRRIKLFSRPAIYLIGIPLFIFVSVICLIRIPSVQSHIVSKAVAYTYDRWGVQIGLKKLYLGFGGSVELEGLVVYDRDCDTLISLDGLSAGLSFYNLYSHRLLFDDIELEAPYLKLYYDTLQDVNIEYIIDMFPNSDTTDTVSSKFYIKSYDLLIHGGRFSFNCRNLDASSGMHYVCPTEVSKLELKAQDVVYTGGKISFSIDTLSLHDAGRLGDIGLSGTGYVNDGTIALSPLSITTSRSDIRMTDFLMTAPEFVDYVDFNDVVRMKGGLTSGRVAMADISGFAGVLMDSHDVFSGSGLFSGTVNDFKVKKAHLCLSDSSYFAGRVEILGCTDPETMFCDIEADSSRFYYDDVRNTSLLGAEQFPGLYPIPYFDSIPWVEYSGNLTGYYKDFVSQGFVSCPWGSVSTDLKITTLRDGGIACEGAASTEGFRLSPFLSPTGMWGGVTGKAAITASFPRNKDFTFSGNVEVASIDFNQYHYTDLSADAVYADKTLQGKFIANDPNFQFEINGKIALGDSVTKGDFKISADRIALSNVGLMPAEYGMVASFNGRVDGWAQNADIFGANATFNSITFQSVSGKITDKNSIVQYLQGGNSKYFNLQSRYINASMRGTFSADNLVAHAQSMLSKVVPESVKAPASLGRDVAIRTRIFSDSLSRVVSLFYPSITCSNKLELDAVLDSHDRSMHFYSTLPFISYNGQKAKNISVDATYTDGYVTGELLADFPGSRRSFPRSVLRFSGDSTGIQSYADWCSSDSSRYHGSLTMDHRFTRERFTDSLQWHINLHPSDIAIEDTVFSIGRSRLLLMNDYIAVDSFMFTHQDRYLGIDGVFSTHEYDTARVSAGNLMLGSFNSLLGEYGISISGALNGQLDIAAAFAEPVVETRATIDNFIFNTVNFGHINVESAWDRHYKQMEFAAQATKHTQQILSVSGNYAPAKSYLVMETVVDSLDITFIDPFLEGILGFKRGWVKGYGWIEGNIDSLTSTGQFYARDFVVRADYLNAIYSLSGPFALKNGKLKFQSMSVADSQKGTGNINGFFSLAALPDLDYDILIKYDKLRSLNTISTDNDLFYGQASSTGAVRLSDDKGKLHVAVAAQVQGGSKIYIPVNSTSSDASSNLLRFVSDTLLKGAGAGDDYPFTMDIELNIKPDSEIQLIMDEQTGDIIKATGNGNIAISVNDKSEVSIMGEYRIDQGEYLFTMMNLLNKRFKINPNSAIYFSGNLDDATVDIQAVYDTKVAVQPLMSPDTLPSYSRRTRAECLLNLTGNLFNPDINFGVNLPDQQGKVVDRLNSFSEDERNRQFLSLLVLSRFSEPEGTASSSSASTPGDSYVNSMEVLSNQLSNWLSGINKDVDIGVNYRPGYGVGSVRTADEVEFGVSTQLFDNRITIDYNHSTVLGSEAQAQDRTENNIGDVSVELKLTDNGKLRLRGFSRGGTSDPLTDNNAQTNGAGIIFTDEFNTFAELFRRKKKKDRTPEPADSINTDMYREEDEPVPEE